MQGISISIEKTVKFIRKQITVRLERYTKECFIKHKTSRAKSQGRTKKGKYLNALRGERGLGVIVDTKQTTEEFLKVHENAEWGKWK